MFLGEGLFGLAAIALWVYCIFDVIRTDEAAVENLPKMIWLLIVIFVPTIGSLAWLLLGRPRRAPFRLQSLGQRAPEPEQQIGLAEPTMSPEEHQRRRDEALRRHQAEREAHLRRREEELKRREDELKRREEDL
jgi:hypothetical protein